MSEPANKQPELKKKTLSKKQSKTTNFALGKRGEDKAALFLQNNGYKLVARNVSYRGYEVDLIATENQTKELVFIEVKTRSQSKYGTPANAVTRKKIAAMYKVANAYLKKNKLDRNFRFDIITVVSGRIKQYRNVTWL